MEKTEKRCKMTMESKRAVIYARYSSSRQREESIERQIEICNDYAVAHNMLVIGSYVDRKKTGKTDTRPDFQRMIYESSKERIAASLCSCVCLLQFLTFSNQSTNSCMFWRVKWLQLTRCLGISFVPSKNVKNRFRASS